MSEYYMDEDARRVKGYMKENEEGELEFRRLTFSCVKVCIRHSKGGVTEITHTQRLGKNKYTITTPYGKVIEKYHPDNFKSYAEEKYGKDMTRRILQALESA